MGAEGLSCPRAQCRPGCPFHQDRKEGCDAGVAISSHGPGRILVHDCGLVFRELAQQGLTENSTVGFVENLGVIGRQSLLAQVLQVGVAGGATVEREAKLVAPAEFSLPDLGGLVPDATALPGPEAHLDATYYDTAELSLARSGITLRHRAGESGQARMLKLPETGRGPVLARTELRFEGTAERVPDPAADLVLVFTRGRPLELVARLVTVRHPVEIRDGESQILAEVVDDAVTVSQDGVPTGGFREVEVHASGRVGRRILRAAARLVEAGCRAEPPVPKLVRAIGERAALPADVVVGALPSDATLADVPPHHRPLGGPDPPPRPGRPAGR